MLADSTLTLSSSGKTFSRHCEFFFPQQTGFDISCKLSPMDGDNLHEMSKSVSEKNKKNISICSPLKSLPRVLRVKKHLCI